MACVFCRIAADEAPSRTVYRTDDIVAFLDVNPLAPGHTLVIPVEHSERLEDLSSERFEELFNAVHHLLPPIQTVVDAAATTVAINNGPAAGQEVPHVHCHIVPRFEGDGGGPVHAAMGRRPELDATDLDDLAERIAAAA